MSELLSYKHILDDIKKFKRSGTKYGDDFNVYDTPAHKYFKILFYFGSTSEFGEDDGSGLLAPTWEIFNTRNKFVATAEAVLENEDAPLETLDDAISAIAWSAKNSLHYYDYNSAWAYLKLNDENERAEKLEQFVTLLSDINTQSPWYFSKIGGLSEALERKATEDGKLEITDKKLTITCLPDAFDNRIGTLLELYRDITWSWIHKKEIIPANLRKFDMAIYIFETPEQNWHKNDSIIDANINGSPVSYKMIEFHDCEFNYNSIKSGWSDIDNATGVQPIYTIDITYGDCYEISYNDIMMRKIGDVIVTDLLNNTVNMDMYVSKAQIDNNNIKELNKYKTNPYTHNFETRYEDSLDWKKEIDLQNLRLKNAEKKKPGFIENATNQVVGHLKSDVTDFVKQKLMGNIFGFSLTGLRDNINDFMQGNIIKTGMTIAQFTREQQNKKQNERNRKTDPSSNNIYTDNTIKDQNSITHIRRNPVAKKNIYDDTVIDSPKKPFGNLFNSETLANNL